MHVSTWYLPKQTVIARFLARYSWIHVHCLLAYFFDIWLAHGQNTGCMCVCVCISDEIAEMLYEGLVDVQAVTVSSSLSKDTCKMHLY
jgi:hypothetical protein